MIPLNSYFRLPARRPESAGGVVDADDVVVIIMAGVEAVLFLWARRQRHWCKQSRRTHGRDIGQRRLRSFRATRVLRCCIRIDGVRMNRRSFE